MKKVIRSLKRLIWILLVGVMVAFHNAYNKEFTSIETVKQELVEDDA